jgi:hypothetical protein
MQAQKSIEFIRASEIDIRGVILLNDLGFMVMFPQVHEFCWDFLTTCILNGQ